MRVFLDEVNTWIKSLSKADLSPQCRWASTNHLKAWTEFSLSLPDCIWLGPWSSPALGLRLSLEPTPSSALLVLRPLDLSWDSLYWLLGSPVCTTTDDCTHLNPEFQRRARRDETGFLSDQCKEIEENNRMGKTRDLFKKIRDTEHFMQRWAQ